MLRRDLTIFIIFLLMNNLAFSTTWHVKQGAAGANNGSENDPWNKLTEVVWGEGGVVDGDTLYVRGVHLWETTPNPSSQRNVTVGASGTSDNRIIIRGDYPGERGIIWGIDTQAGSQRTWTDEGNNVYSVVTGEYNHFFFEDVTTEGGTILEKIATTTGNLTGTWTFTEDSTTVQALGEDGKAQAELDDGDYVRLSSLGTIYKVDGEPTSDDEFELTVAYGGTTVEDTTDETISIDTSAHIALVQAQTGSYWSATYEYPDEHYFHCTDNGNPDGRIVGGINGWYIYVTGQEYITFKEIWFYRPRVIGAPMTYIRFEDCRLWYHSSLSISDNAENEAPHHIEFINCDMAYANGGIGIKDWYTPHGTGTPHHITVRNCYIHDIGVLDITQNGDAEGIGVNGCDDLTVEYNEFYNCGSGVTLYPYENQSSARCIVRYNYIHDLHQLYDPDPARGMGVEFTMRAQNVLEKPGNMCYGNIVSNAPDYAYKCTWATDQVVFYNNIAYNCGGSFYFNYTYTNDLGPNIVLRNNISMNPKDLENRFHIYYGSLCGEEVYILDSDYNIFYPDAEDLFAFKETPAKTFVTNFADWQSYTRQGCTFDTHSQLIEPGLKDVTVDNFFPNSDSPCIDEGVDVGITEDRFGVSIPQGNGVDIGSYEWCTGYWSPPM